MRANACVGTTALSYPGMQLHVPSESYICGTSLPSHENLDGSRGVSDTIDPLASSLTKAPQKT